MKVHLSVDTSEGVQVFHVSVLAGDSLNVSDDDSEKIRIRTEPETLAERWHCWRSQMRIKLWRYAKLRWLVTRLL